MGSITLIKSPQSKALVRELSARVLTARLDPLQMMSIVFPNQHFRDVMTWALLSDDKSKTSEEESTQEVCLSGTRKLYVSELISTLTEAYGASQFPSSEELAWGLIARSIFSGSSDESEPRSGAQVRSTTLSDAQSISELLFRLPTNAPSTLTTSGVELRLPQSLDPHNEISDYQGLWQDLIEHRNEDVTHQILDDSRWMKHARGRASIGKHLRGALGPIHLVAPKALSITLLRLLKLASEHLDITIYLLTEDRPALPSNDSFSYANYEAFELNLKAIMTYCAPTNPIEGTSSDLTTAHPSEGAQTPPKVELHTCTHDSRQTEVLRESLMEKMSTDSTLTQRDILVLVSDMGRFLPYIEQHFYMGHAQPKNQLSAVIIDRGIEEENTYETLIFMLSRMPSRRLSLELIFELYTLTPIRECFVISEGRLERLKGILSEANLKWGIDTRDRARLSNFKSPLHTWRFVIERLLMSELVDPTYTPQTPYLDVILPTTALGSSDYAALSTFLDFFSTVETLLDEHPARRPHDEEELRGGSPYKVWQDWLFKCLDTLTLSYQADKTENLRKQMVKQALQQVELDLSRAHPEALPKLYLTTGALMGAVSAALKSYRSMRGRPGTGVTFAPIAVGAGTPARVVAFLGMEEGAFPQQLRLNINDPLNPRHPQRTQQTPQDLASSPSWCQEASLSPSQSASGWAGFLSAYSNASDHLIALWTGVPRFIHEEGREPCAPIRYLIECEPSLKDHVFKEPVSPYDPSLFMADAPRSKNPYDFQAAQVVAQGPKDLGELTLPTSSHHPRARTPKGSVETVTLSQIAKSISEPQTTFLREAGYQFQSAQKEMTSAVPTGLDSLQSWQLKTQLTDDLLEHWHTLRDKNSFQEAEGQLKSLMPTLYETSYQRLRAEAILPPGALGRSTFEEQWASSHHVFWHLTRLLDKYKPHPHREVVELDLSRSHNLKINVPLTIYLPRKQDERPSVLEFTYSTIQNRPSKLLNSWLRSLAIQHIHETPNTSLHTLPPLDFTQLDHHVIGPKKTLDYKHLNPKHKYAESEKLICLKYEQSVEGDESPTQGLFSNIEEVAHHYHAVRQGDSARLHWNFDLYDKMLRKTPKPVLEVIEGKRESYGQEYQKFAQKQADTQSQFLFGDTEYFITENGEHTPSFESGYRFAEALKNSFTEKGSL